MVGTIPQWLKSLGLAKYAKAFAEGEIDFEVLRHLGEDDLRELGLPLGPRKKLLAAIAELGLPEPAPLPSGAPAREAERRQLTVMFVDLVGSTELAGRLDPEDLREVIRAYQETCAQAVARFEGHIAKYIGDGLLVYFGYPQAHEDDARRAVSAGLGIVEGIAALNRRFDDGREVELSVRIGVHTGLVVAGEMGGGATREIDAIVGETPNIAARLEGLAEPNTVAIGAATQRLVEGLFEYDDLGPQKLKGVSEPVRVFRVRGESAAPSRFEAAAELGLTSLVGREEEIGLLLKRWAQAKDGEGQVVLLSGEAGVGKSRILRAFRERLEDESHSRVLYYCSAYHLNSALYPAIEQLERVLRFARDEGPARKFDKLEAVLGDLGLSVADTAPILASLLSLPLKGRYQPLEFAPQQLKAKMLEASIAVFEAMAAQAPVLMVVEDAHWIDPSTVELLGLLIERLASARVLLVLTFRPEFEPPWSGRPHLTLHALNRLGRKETTAMVAEVTGGKTLPDEVLDLIVAKTDGVPLYVEELTKTVLESGVLEEDGEGHVLTGPLPPLAIPASLQDSLMARLDRLAGVKEVAQLAAVLGRTFRSELLATVSSLGEAELNHALDVLVEVELVYRRGVAPDVSYEFKHALIQETAYQSLLKSTKRTYHLRIARALESGYKEIAETEPEVLAHHYTEAGEAARAVDYWTRAGERAAGRSANIEAVAHLRRGLALLEALPGDTAIAERELRLLIALGPALMATQGWGTPEVEDTYARARHLAQETNKSGELFPAVWGLWLVAHAGGENRAAMDMHHELFSLAGAEEDPMFLLQAHHAGGSTMCSAGELESAQRHIEDGIALYQPKAHSQQALTYGGHDPCVCAHSLGALNLLMLGRLDQAQRYSEEALSLAHQVGHAPSVAHAYSYRAELCQILGLVGEAEERAEQVLAVAVEMGMAQYAAWGTMMRGWALAVRGETREGLAQSNAGWDALKTNGIKYHLPHRIALRSRAHAAAGDVDVALEIAAEALASVEQTGEHWFEAEALRLQAVLLLAKPAPDVAGAEQCLRRAHGVATKQGARFWQLRAATGLARLLGDQGKAREGRDLLAPAHGWFSEGLDTADLKDAKALLDELA